MFLLLFKLVCSQLLERALWLTLYYLQRNRSRLSYRNWFNPSPIASSEKLYPSQIYLNFVSCILPLTYIIFNVEHLSLPASQWIRASTERGVYLTNISNIISSGLLVSCLNSTGRDITYFDDFCKFIASHVTLIIIFFKFIPFCFCARTDTLYLLIKIYSSMVKISCRDVLEEIYFIHQDRFW